MALSEMPLSEMPLSEMPLSEMPLEGARIDVARRQDVRIDSAVDSIVVSSRAILHATDSHSMPIPEPRARCTRHDRVVSGAPAAYMGAVH
jgi:hypothetical protein